MISLTRILVPTDFSEPSDAALTYGRELAMRFGGTLHVLHVVENISFAAYGLEGYMGAFPEWQAEIEEESRRRLHGLLIDTDKSGPATVPALRTSGSPAATIVEYAKDNGIDLIVMGTHGRGAVGHLIMGNVAERVVRLAPCPVLTVRHPEHEFVRPDTLAAIAQAPTTGTAR
jgi:nucleotide-binding universal stress UspA family protein